MMALDAQGHPGRWPPWLLLSGRLHQPSKADHLLELVAALRRPEIAARPGSSADKVLKVANRRIVRDPADNLARPGGLFLRAARQTARHGGGGLGIHIRGT